MRIDPDGMLDDINIYANKGDKKPLLVLKTDKVDQDIYLISDQDHQMPPMFEDLSPPMTININQFLSDEDSDANIVSLTGEITVGACMSHSLDIVTFNKGENAGETVTYYTQGAGGGFSGGASLSFGTIDFNENSGKTFSKNTLLGISASRTIGIGPISETQINGYTDNKFHIDPNLTSATESYSAHLLGVGVGGKAGAAVYKTTTRFAEDEE